MKSYYGNLVVDIFDLVFAVVSLLLVWISCAKDSAIFFGITAAIYMFPRLLSVILGIVNNGRDVVRLIIDVVSLLMLLASFFMVSLIMFDSFIESFQILHTDFVTLNIVFYILSALSLSSIVYKVIVGIIQKFFLTIRNYKSKSN